MRTYAYLAERSPSRRRPPQGSRGAVRPVIRVRKEMRTRVEHACYSQVLRERTQLLGKTRTHFFSFASNERLSLEVHHDLVLTLHARCNRVGRVTDFLQSFTVTDFLLSITVLVNSVCVSVCVSVCLSVRPSSLSLSLSLSV